MPQVNVNSEVIDHVLDLLNQSPLERPRAYRIGRTIIADTLGDWALDLPIKRLRELLWSKGYIILRDFYGLR